MKNIGQGGLQTSFVVKKSLIKKLLKGDGTCQENINDEIDNSNKTPWLQLVHVIQNIKGKGIATIIGKIKSKDVVVKVQQFDAANNEYNVQQKLKISELQGFVDFECIFTCDGDRKYIESFSYFNDASRLCKAKGYNMGIIIMPYYKNASFESFLKTYKEQDKIDKAKHIIASVIKNVFNAFTLSQFTHGDLFSKNVVLDDEYNPIIIDFEKSLFNNNLMRFLMDIDDFINDVARYMFDPKLSEISRQFVTMNRAFNNKPNEEILSSFTKAILNL